MFERTEKIAIILILAMFLWVLIKPTIIDQNKINAIVKVVNQQQVIISRHENDISLLKQSLVKPEIPK